MNLRRTAGIALLMLPLAAFAGCDAIQYRRTMDEGNKLYTAQKYDEAIERYERILQKQPDDWAANYQIAVSNLAMFHPGSTHPKDKEIKEEALKYLEKLMTLQPPDPAAMDKVNNFYLSLLTAAGEDDKAIAFLEKKLASTPNDVNLIAQLAGMHAKKGNFDQALAYYEKKAQLDPKDKTAWYTVGVVCWERSNKAGALVAPEERAQIIDRGLQALQKALQIDPEYGEAIAYVNLLYREQAQVLYQAGKFQESQQATAKADEYRARAVELFKKRKAEQAAAAPAQS